MAIEIQAVSNGRQLRQFLQLRRNLYHAESQMIFPLKRMELQQVDAGRHPFYDHAIRELFIAYQDGAPVGRIAAIKDQLQQEYQQNKQGFFGFLEAIDDLQVIQKLVEAAESWLKDRGCDRMLGPVNPSMKGEFGVLVQGHDTPPSVMTAHTFARYRDQLIDLGFDLAREFYSFQFLSRDASNSRERWAKLFQVRDKVLKRYPQLSFRAVDEASFDKTMREINELGNRVRAEGWGFVPLTDDELSFMIQNLRRVIRYDMIHVAYWEDKLVGYIVNIPDINWALSKTWGKSDWLRMLQLPFLIRRCPKTRVIALGVDQDYRAKGIAMILIARLVDTYDAFDEWEFSWVDSMNQKSIRAIGRTLPLVKTKTYQLFEKAIATDQGSD